MTPKDKRVLTVTLTVLLAAGIATGAGTFLAMQHGVKLNNYGNEVGGSFRLMDASTGSMTDLMFRGRWIVVLFGATHCTQDACETALRNMSEALNKVDPYRRNASIIFVSLDPQRDNAPRLHQYTDDMGTRVVAGTASPEALAELAREYHAPVEKISDPEWGYTMKMSPSFVVMDPDAHYKGSIDATLDAGAMQARLEQIMHPDAKQ
ncbi:SCO family protein [Acetobacter thailandicus]|uniref:SCO family protein n=1 Tax=Acetobacter thailandicus TaxID=1502842 RepID=A0ABT3QG75_9PROT|nr:SCO family protein [Acetobacter thailandicus]MCX2564289.1 SCO family protein [Acetobacter thailandicus]NHN95274.1 SCO family protein [Acetobacter thailandicus]